VQSYVPVSSQRLVSPDTFAEYLADESNPHGVGQIACVRNVMHAEVEPNDLNRRERENQSQRLPSPGKSRKTDQVFLLEILAVEVFLKVDDRVKRVVAVGADCVSSNNRVKTQAARMDPLVRSVSRRKLRVVLFCDPARGSALQCHGG
jgi:hypothetical protein